MDEDPRKCQYCKIFYRRRNKKAGKCCAILEKGETSLIRHGDFEGYTFEELYNREPEYSLNIVEKGKFYKWGRYKIYFYERKNFKPKFEGNEEVYLKPAKK
jgi:hypothetical protein